jgi:hypothetical protein
MSEYKFDVKMKLFVSNLKVWSTGIKLLASYTKDIINISIFKKHYKLWRNSFLILTAALPLHRA